MENAEQFLIADDLDNLMLEIDDAITATFDAEGYPSKVGLKLERIYDSLYDNN